MIRNDNKTRRRTELKTSSRHSGFTIIELMVSMSVVGILLALLLPAVQQSRATARRFSCTNNLRQIGLANQNFLDAHGHFPSSSSTSLDLLPYLEQQALYDKMSGMDQIRRQLLKGDLPVYQCPDDSLISGSTYLVSYLVNNGTATMSDGKRSFSNVNGMLYAQRMRDVVDGASNTAFYSERLQRIRVHSDDYANTNQPTRYAWLVNLQNQTVDALAASCSDSHSRIADGGGIFPMSFSIGRVSQSAGYYDHIVTPNTPLCRAVGGDALYATVPATSQHSGGVNMMLVDGSVRFVSENISRDIWRAYGTRNGGEVISDF